MLNLDKKEYDNTDAEIIHHGNDADLGLFNQLLQMIEGDWSDSVQGICDHILDKFKALAIFLSVFDKNYNEFIYISYSIKDGLDEKIKKYNMKMSRETVLDILKKVSSREKSILEYGLFSGEGLFDLAKIYFDGQEKITRSIIEDTGVKTVYAIPDLDANKDYTCFFHIITPRSVNENERILVNEYLTQLHVALEIVFHVRDLYIKATHDGLTKLFNHKQGLILLRKEMDRVIRNKQPLSIAMMDIDHFKIINDTHGHLAGNMVLEYISSLLTDSLRKCDIVSRYGGEEILIILPDTGTKSALIVLKRLKDSIQDHVFKSQTGKFHVTASFGLAQFNPKAHDDVDSFLDSADEMLLSAKRNGRNRIELKLSDN